MFRPPMPLAAERCGRLPSRPLQQALSTARTRVSGVELRFGLGKLGERTRIEYTPTGTKRTTLRKAANAELAVFCWPATPSFFCTSNTRTAAFVRLLDPPTLTSFTRPTCPLPMLKPLQNRAMDFVCRIPTALRSATPWPKL